MNNRENKKNELLELICKCLEGIEDEIKKSGRGEAALDDLVRLQFIKSGLSEMQSRLIQENLPEDSAIEPNIARIVIDSWPINDPLGEQICQIEYRYKRLFKGR